MHAAERHEMRKKSKYEALSVQDDTIPNLVPLVICTLWVVGVRG